MGLLKRLQGVFFEPRSTFEGLAAKPVWIDTLVVVLLALIAFNLLVSPYTIQDQIKIMKDNEVVLKERLGEDTFNKRLQTLENPSLFRTVTQTIVGTIVFYIVALLLQALILLVLGRLVSTQGTYAAVLSILFHANLVDKLLGNAVRLPIILIRKSAAQVSTSLAMVFPKMEIFSTPFVILSQFDFFQLWMFGILAFGLAAVFKISLKKALVMSYGLWLLKALFNIVGNLILMGFYR